MTGVAPTTFAEFWPMYLRAHQNPTSRLLHYLGTFASLLCWTLFAMTRDWRWIAAAVIVPYSFAWAGHFFVEHNVPLAFSRPLWSVRADFRMFALALAGRLMPRMDAAVRNAA